LEWLVSSSGNLKLTALLDANVLLALAWRNHVHHEAAHRWFARHKDGGWATCVVTEAAFVRLSANPAVVGRNVSVGEAQRILDASVRVGRHEFWPMETALGRIHPAIRERLAGPKQITDAVLLDLAIRKSGRFATFDKRVMSLLPPDSADRTVIELLPV
jgi:toxin-antitoxin system PIN domain toxin